MNDQHQDVRLSEIAEGLRRRRVAGAARLFLEIIDPVAFLASQTALFVQPFTPRGRWHDYIDVLTKEANWRALRRLVDQQEC